MPIIPTIPGVDFSGIDLTKLYDKDIEYSYPEKMDLKPDSDYHGRLLARLMRMATDSSMVMSANYDTWEQLDKVVNAYIYEPSRVNASEKSTSSLRQPEVVIPISYAQLEILLTYMSTAFLKDPIFPYRGTGPEDAYGVQMLERVVQNQSIRHRIGLNLHTQWRDNFVYGFGVVTPYWKRTYGSRNTKIDEEIMTAEGVFLPTGRKVKKRQRNILKSEGNALENVDPYCFLPDPRVSVDQIEKAEYCGWTTQETYLTLTEEEKAPHSSFFNVEYLKTGSDILSSLDTSKTRRKNQPRRESTNSYGKTVDVLWLYVNLIPADWEINDGKDPELWLFGVAGDKVIIYAEPLDDDHGMLPAIICATNFDGYSATAQSQIGTIFGLQEILDFLYSSHIVNIRKAINDILVVDPQLINIKDVQNPSPGKIIRLRRAAWGKGRTIDQAIKQLEVRDYTQGHIEEANFVIGLMGESTGGTSMMRGNPFPRTSRISATEVNRLGSNSFSRLERHAQIIDLQSHGKLSNIFASNCIQYMEEQTYVDVAGELAQRIQQDFGQQVDKGFVRVSPLDIVVDYDVQPHDGKIPGSQSPVDWIELMKIAGQVPQIVEVLNWPVLFKHIARMLGVTNVDDFVNSGVRVRVAPDDVVAREAQAGNIQPIQQAYPPASNGVT